jgi:malate dehydrogenase (oxaloacetate-decarboxylating)
VVATGRGDFPNQLNNSLVFPGLFRGALDVRARTITDGMARSLAQELARFAESRSIHDGDILPRMDEWDVFPRLATAAGLAAQADGVALVSKDRERLYGDAARTMRDARAAVGLLMREGLIAGPPSA